MHKTRSCINIVCVCGISILSLLFRRGLAHRITEGIENFFVDSGKVGTPTY